MHGMLIPLIFVEGEVITLEGLKIKMIEKIYRVLRDSENEMKM